MAAPTSITLDGVRVVGGGVHGFVAEDLVAGLRVARLGAIDPDRDTPFAFTLLDDAGGRFFITGANLRVTEGAVLDFADGSYTIRVRVTDSAGETLERDIVLGITDVAGHIVRTDGTAGDDTQASASGGREFFLATAGDDTITGAGSDVVVYAGRRADYAVVVTEGESGEYGGAGTPDQITVRDLRAGGPDGEDLLLESVSQLRFADGDHDRSQLSASGTTGLLLDGRSLAQGAYVFENAAAGTVIAQLAMRGRPAGELPVITTFEVLAFRNSPIFIPPDIRNDLFEVDAAGQLVVTGNIDFETYSDFGLRVFYEDALGNADFDVITIVVDDVNDPPAIASAPGASVSPPILLEHTDTSADVLLGDITLFDPDGAPLGYLFSLSGADAQKFKVIGQQLFLRAGAVLDFEGDPTLDVTLSVRDRTLPPESALPRALTFNVGFAPLLGAAGNDTLIATDGVDVVRGLAGDDRLLGRAGSDLVDGGDGADTLLDADGHDSLIGGRGADKLVGGAGDDALFGDFALPVSGLTALRWTAQGPNGTNLATGFAQTVGALTATVSITDDGALISAAVTTTPEYIVAGEPFATDSALALTGLGPDTATVTVTFTDAGGDAEAGAVLFRINDIDQADHRDRIAVTARDSAGNPLTVTLRADGDDEVAGGIATAGPGLDEPSEIGGSVLVTILGAVHSVSIAYTNLGVTDQLVTITDLHIDPGGPTPADTALNDTLLGGAGNDSLAGGAGDDFLKGGEDSDTIIGGYGRDVMDGEAGADLFRFLSVTESSLAARDLIRDFQPGSDSIDLSSISAAGGGSLFFQAVTGAAFTGAAGEIRAVTAGGGQTTRLLVDLDGDRAADMAIDLLGAPVVGAADFIL